MKSVEQWPSEARHCLRVGSLSDKRVIERCQSQFDVLVVQGNLAVSAPQGLATWPLEKPVWIDPITYAFAASPVYLRSSGKKGGYKKTFVKLANAFGAPYSEVLESDRALTPDDFSDLAGSVESVLGWQENVFAPADEDTKYGAHPISPALLTAPFFPLTVRDAREPSEPSWMAANIDMIRAAAELRSPARLAAGFLAELDVLDHPSFIDWLSAYADVLDETNVRHLWWWISDHDEVQTSLQRATLILQSFEMLAERGIAVHQAFGGSLSSFALTHGLTTVAHGVNYWESKGWEPIASGGLPTARYFHPGLRERLRVPEAIALVDQRIENMEEFYSRVCDCVVCREVVAGDVSGFGAFGAVNIKTRRTRGGGVAEFDSPTAEALLHTKAHYLHAKAAEVALALSPGFSASDRLEADAEFWASDIARTRHLDRWALALNVRIEEPL
jgi:hypothetical protein